MFGAGMPAWSSLSATLGEAVRTHRRVLVQLAIAIISLAVLFGPSLVEHAANAANPRWLNDDSRMQIWPFFRYHDPTLFEEDFAADYLLSSMPAGYKLLYRCWSAVADPRTLSKVLPYLLLLVLLVATGVGAGRLGGAMAAWGAVALCLSSSYFLSRMSGGLPRSFGFPLIGTAAAALVLGRPVLLAACTVLGAAFYPSAGLVSGIALAGYLFILPAADRGRACHWPLLRRAAVVGITAVVSVAILWPGIRALEPFGPWIRPHEVAEYPEAGPGGRTEIPPYASFSTEAATSISRTLIGRGRPWPAFTGWMRGDDGADETGIRALLLSVACLSAVGSIALALRDPAARRLLLLLLGGLLAYAAAVAVEPSLYVPARYAEYPVTVLTVILVPVGACGLGGLLARRLKRPRLQPAAGLALIVATLLGLGSRGDAETGLNIRIDSNDEVYSFLETLPPDALIAGWPDGLMDNIPYLCRRRVLISQELHIAFHRRYLLEMRRRMTALVDAYYASDPAPLIRLREEFGVTHLVLDASDYAEPPVYFKPYNAYIINAFEHLAEGALEARTQMDRAVIFADGPVVVVDLSRILP